jgi:cobalt/nickel transport system permease protein
MSKLKEAMFKISSLEELTHKNTAIHRLHPCVKLFSTILYLIIVISFAPVEISGLLPFLLYPVMVMAVGEIPIGPIFSRLMIAMPFSLLAGVSNMLVSREVVFFLGSLAITRGMLTLLSILLKSILAVLAVLILIATTTISDLLRVMLQLKLPSILVLQLTMTFRYLGILIEELQAMYHAYLLRAPKEKGIKMKDMGAFLGQLILRSFDRAERVYHAMKCRGFEGRIPFSRQMKIPLSGWIYLILVCGLFLLLRMNNISESIGSWLYYGGK